MESESPDREDRAARRPRRPRRRRRREAPGPGRVYLWGLTLVIPALLIALISVRPQPGIIGESTLRATFDAGRAGAFGAALARSAPNRGPGQAGDTPSVEQVTAALASATTREVEVDSWTATDATGSTRTMHNLIVTSPGAPGAPAILIAAERADPSAEVGAGSGAAATAALVELARSLTAVSHQDTLIFASLDGAAAGHAGARRLADQHDRRRISTAIVVGPIGRISDLPVLDGGSDGIQSQAGLTQGVLVQGDRAGIHAVPPAVDDQLAALVLPYRVAGAQGPFVDHGIAAVQLGPDGPVGRPARLQLERIGTLVNALVLQLDASPPPGGPRGRYLWVADRVMPSWALRLVFAALLLAPALVIALLVVQARRLRLPVAAAGRAAARAIGLAAGGVTALLVCRAVGLIPAGPWSYPFAASGVGVGALLAIALGAAAGERLASRWGAPPRRPDPALLVPALYAVVAGLGLSAILVGVLRLPTAMLPGVFALHGWVIVIAVGVRAWSARAALVWLPMLAVTSGAVLVQSMDPLDVVRAVADLPLLVLLGFTGITAGALALTAAPLLVRQASRGGPPE